MSLALPSEGGCQCGEIRYRLTGEPVWLAVCHCNDCLSIGELTGLDELHS
jgi:hypothetical protein